MPDFQPTAPKERKFVSVPPDSVQSVDEALEQIDRILQQMLLLSELSAGNGTVDRDSLQKTLERLRNRIDHIADAI